MFAAAAAAAEIIVKTRILISMCRSESGKDYDVLWVVNSCR
jgi:hypothetical protein